MTCRKFVPLAALAALSAACGPQLPGAPTEVIAVRGIDAAFVRWTPPLQGNGIAEVSSYTVTATPGGRTAFAFPGERRALVTGLSSGETYRFTVTANVTSDEQNPEKRSGPPSEPSPAVTMACNPFPNGETIGTGTLTTDVDLADIDGDGMLDLIASVASENLVTVHRGVGDGTFATTPAKYTVGQSPQAVAAIDVNADGRRDLVTANRVSQDVTVRLGLASGFAASVSSYVADAVKAMEATELDGDGLVDLVVAGTRHDDVSFVKNGGNAAFSLANIFDSGTDPRSVVVGDVDGDGLTDFASVAANPAELRLVINDGGGEFKTPHIVTLPAGSEPYDAKFGDLNGDERVDAVVALGIHATEENETVNVKILLNNGGGQLVDSGAGYKVTGSSAVGVHLADVNGDTRLDLIVAVPNEINILVGDGTGNFGPPKASPTGLAPQRMQTADLNGDGRQDLAVANLTGDSVSVFVNRCQ